MMIPGRDDIGSRPKKKLPFLRRGEGTQKRVFGSKIAAEKRVMDAAKQPPRAHSSPGSSQSILMPTRQRQAESKLSQRQVAARDAARAKASSVYEPQDSFGVTSTSDHPEPPDSAAELVCEKQLVSITDFGMFGPEEDESHLRATGPRVSSTNDGGPTNGLAGEDDRTLMQEDKELEEFRRLERQFKRELGESVSSMPPIMEHAAEHSNVALGHQPARDPGPRQPSGSDRPVGLDREPSLKQEMSSIVFDDSGTWADSGSDDDGLDDRRQTHRPGSGAGYQAADAATRSIASMQSTSQERAAEVAGTIAPAAAEAGRGQRGAAGTGPLDQITSRYVRSIFQANAPANSGSSPKVQPNPDASNESGDARDPAVEAKVAALDEEIKKFQGEQSRLKRIRTEMERTVLQLDQERRSFQDQKERELAELESTREEELRKLRRDRRVLEKQSRALLKLPTRKERSEIEAVEAVLERERREGKAREARHKLTLQRLRQQIRELQDQSSELQEELRWYQEQQVKQRFPEEPPAPKRTNASTQTDRVWESEWPRPTGDGTGRRGGELTSACPASPPSGGSHRSLPRRPSSAAPGGAAAWDAAPGSSSARLSSQRSAVAAAAEDSEAVSRWTEPGGGRGRTPSSEWNLELRGPVAAEPAGPWVESSCHRAEWSAGASFHRGRMHLTASPAQHSPHETQQPADALWRTAPRTGGGAAAGRRVLDDVRVSRHSAYAAAPPAQPAHVTWTQPPQAPGPEFEASAAAAKENRPEHGNWAQRAGAAPSAKPGPPLHARAAALQGTASQLQQGEGWERPHAAASAPSAVQARASTAGTRAAAGHVGMSSSSIRAPTSLVKEVRHSDGKVEQHFDDGRRTVRFGNGTLKHQLPDGRTLIHFTNRDAKVTLPSGQVQYYYAEVDTWHITHPNAIEVFFFPNRQVEAHHPDRRKEIRFPDGLCRVVMANGQEHDVDRSHLCPEVLQQQPVLVEVV